MGRTIFTSILQELEQDLDRLTSENHPVPFHTQQAIGLCLLTYNELRKIVLKTGFITNTEEVAFFKTIKPQVYSKLTFYRRLARIDSHRPRFTREDQVTYLRDEIRKIHEYYAEHSDFCEYYQTRQTYNDELYFTRNQKKIVLNNRNSDYLTDPEFSTIHDKTVATFMAYENLEKYLDNEIRKLQGGNPAGSADNQAKVPWTGNHVSLVELFYALRELGVINNGQTSVKEMYAIFSKVLQLPEIDLYGTFQDIQKRKKNKTIFLDKLREALNRKLDESDEYKP